MVATNFSKSSITDGIVSTYLAFALRPNPEHVALSAFKWDLSFNLAVLEVLKILL